jgi:lipopolysaccharide biosynthesis glycosyltransferase
MNMSEHDQNKYIEERTMNETQGINSRKDTIHIVLAVYDPKENYSRHAGVVMTSIFEHTKSPVRVHILHDGTLTDDNRQRFSRTAEKFGQEVRFIDVTEPFSKINQNGEMDKLSKQFTRGSLFRLFIPDLLDIEKVIYMDCDVTVSMDISELWNVPLRSSGCSLAAVIETSGVSDFQKNIFEKMRAYILNLTWDKYFLSGMLLMDLERIRQKHNLMREAKNFFERFALLFRYPDQDFLNATFKGDVLFLEERFNRIKDPDNDINDAILHYANVKPWQFLRDSARDKFYWDTFMRSEWSEQLSEALRDLCDGRYMHRHSSDCIKRVARSFLENLRRTFTVSFSKRFQLCRMAVSKLSRGVLNSKN